MDSSLEVLKRRGRKKKEVVDDDKPLEKKKRGRKKKWESFAHTKIIMPESDEEDNKSSITERIDNNNYEKESIAFGGLNITVHANKDNSNTTKIKDSIFKNLDTTKKTSVCKIELENSDIDDNSDYEYSDDLFKGKSIKYHTDDYSVGKELNRTDVYCYNCCHPFFTKQCVLPIDYDATLKRYKVFGNFCSPNCAKRYAIEHKTLYNKTYLLSNMYRELYDSSYVIKPAPSKFLLKCFGGKLSIEDYRNNFNDAINYTIKPINTKTIHMEICEF